MKEPWFWRENGLASNAAALALWPAAALYDAGQRLRSVAAKPARVGAPVICIGNATLGGVGKTPFALMLQAMLLKHGIDAEFQSRGYGGALRGPVLVGDHHTAEEVGDEPLLLAGGGRTWVAKDRLAGLRAAAAGGAEAIIMDDGLQNPTMKKDVSFLLVDAANPAGNNRTFPCGPLREPMMRAMARADAVVQVGRTGAALDTGGRPLFRASTGIEPTISPCRAVAFCGIGRPDRYFDMLEARGFSLAARHAFPDHHRYRPAELERLKREAAAAKAALITTEKDYVRLAPEAREGVAVARLRMHVDDPGALTRLVLSKIASAR